MLTRQQQTRALVTIGEAVDRLSKVSLMMAEGMLTIPGETPDGVPIPAVMTAERNIANAILVMKLKAATDDVIGISQAIKEMTLTREAVDLRNMKGVN